MKPIYLLSVLIILFASSCDNNNGSESISLIPLPNFIEYQSSTFLLENDADIQFSELISESSFENLGQQFVRDHGIQQKAGGDDSVLKMINNTELKPEAYILEINSGGITIEASDYNGFFYGIQTLSQLIDQGEKTAKGLKLPCISIKDEPAFAWRGMHLDVCRHFFEVSTIKKMLDAMAMHKMNTFHWHLTEDQGWRIEIEKYPLLSEISAWRNESVVGHIAQEPIQYDGIKHGGIYTKNEIKDVVAYASKLGITIVPEIEMPGHAVAALMAYPELSCTGKPTPFNDWGVSSDVYCAGNESTFEFLENVLAEVVELFPGEYIHVGGDECPKDRWKECPKCQKRMKDEGLKDEHELQSYFIQRMEKFLNSKGRKLIGWDEILEGGLADNAVVMSWRGEEGGIEAAEQNHYVVMTPNPVCYFDHYQSNNYEPLAIGGLTTMEEIYNWSVIPSGLDAEKHNFVLGAQANLWTEYIPNPEHLEYMAYPRLCALSEKVWTKKENQNFEDFTARMATHYMRLDAKNINYRIPYPEIEPYNPILNANQKIELKNGVESSSIYYTIDGTEPTKNSKKYENPFRIDLSSPIEIKAVTIMPSGRESAVASGVYELVELAEPETPKNLIQGISYNRYNNAYSSAFDIIGNPDTIYTIQKLELPWQEPVASYGAILKAWIEVPEDGIYNFHLHVKDGGLLYINNKLVVNNDGFKYGSAKSGKAALKAGLYPFEIKYFLGRGWTELTLKYQIDNGEILEVEANQFFSTKMNKLNTRSNE